MEQTILALMFVFPAMSWANGVNMIDDLLAKDNYATPAWESRGLIPSPPETIHFMEQTTKQFLLDLKALSEKSELTEADLRKQIIQLVDDLPWNDLDTEEKEFLANVLAPAIQSMGFNPWAIF